MGIVRSSSWRRLPVSLATQQRPRVTRRGPIRDRDTHSPRGENKSKTCNARRTQCRTPHAHARKQGRKSRSRRKLPQLSRLSQGRLQLQLRMRSMAGVALILDPWSSCCRLNCPAPRLSTGRVSRVGGRDFGVVVVCVQDGVVWVKIVGTAREARNAVATVCGCPRSRVAQAMPGQSGSNGGWLLCANPGTGPVLFTFCIRPWPAFIWRHTRRVVWRTEQLPPAVCRPLRLCRPGATGHHHPMTQRRQPRGTEPSLPRIPRLPRPAQRYYLPGPPAALCDFQVCATLWSSNKPKKAKTSRHQLAVQGSPMRELRNKSWIPAGECAKWSTGSSLVGPTQLAALNSDFLTQFCAQF